MAQQIQDPYTSIGNIGTADGKSILYFRLNPTTVTRDRTATYAQIATAYADFTGNYAGNPPVEWIRNMPEIISVELLVTNVYGGPNGFGAIDSDLEMLDDFMSADRTTGEPQDLLFVYGKRFDRVRILRKGVVEQIHDKALNCERAVVRLEMVAIKSRRI